EPGTIVATASSRAVSDPLGRPQAAVDRDLGTGWVAAPDDEAPELTLSWAGQRDVTGLRIVVEASLSASRPSRAEVTARDESYQVAAAADGSVRLPEPVRTSELTMRVVAVHEVVDTDASFGVRSVLPAGVSELAVLGADDLRTAVDESAPVALACGGGPEL